MGRRMMQSLSILLDKSGYIQAPTNHIDFS